MLTILTDIATRFYLRKGHGRWSGPCPKCGGSKTSDKFVIRDDGGFKCYACPFKGDVITLLRELDGKTCPEAHEAAGLSCRVASCGAADKCRLGNGKAIQARRKSCRLAPPHVSASATLLRSPAKVPTTPWQEWAGQFVTACANYLPAEVFYWLNDRGISPETVSRFRLGWNAKNRKVELLSLGLPPAHEGENQTVWVPVGLVISVTDDHGRVIYLKIRRPDNERERFLPNLKYVEIKGSGSQTMVIRPHTPSRGAVIVEAALDGMAVAAAHHEVTVVALGTVKLGIPQELVAELSTMPVLLIALDTDGRTATGKIGAGPAAVAAWLAEFPRAKFWPVPTMKDPGEYAKQGGDLHSWLESGLVPKVSAIKPHDSTIAPESSVWGGGGYIEASAGESFPNIVEVAALDGRRFSLVSTKEEWLQEVESGRLAFSVNEVERLRLAMGGVDPSGGALALDIKELFPGAYIKSGRVASSLPEDDVVIDQQPDLEECA